MSLDGRTTRLLRVIMVGQIGSPAVRVPAAALVAVAVACTAATATPAAGAAAPAAPVRATADGWPVPIPDWFWDWARWYLGRGEYADLPFRSNETRPVAAPPLIPDWAWRRLQALLGQELAQPEREPLRSVRLWPVPVPDWFWVWARWHLGRGEFADDGRHESHARPPAAPTYIPEWAWQRLRLIRGEEPVAVPARTLGRGDQGPDVAAMQRALNGARYIAGPADGVFGTKTRYGVIAFEKASGLDPDGVVPPDEWIRIVRSRRPPPPLASPASYVYVDLRRQVLYDVRQGDVIRVLPASTGGGYTYTGLDGNRHLATTPTGTFEVFRKVPGKDKSYLGTLYYPSYFTNGYAIHGSESVPPRPVSHGCVRIPLWLAQEFFGRMRIGTPVVVR